MKNVCAKWTLLALILVPTTIVNGYAADRGRDDRRGERDRGRYEHKPGYRVDHRHDHNRAYPPRGAILHQPHDRHRPIHYRDRDYFYFRGIWYLPSGPDFVVVRPPLGIIVPLLPPFYTTIWFSGVPYYYANDVYYVWRPDLNGYQVTAPPAMDNQPEPSYQADQIFIYPKEEQNEQQQADDRYTCHRWSADQTGYDPTQPQQNLSIRQLNQAREEYRRAMVACLEGKGYSVR